jgi:AraC-like DNA-binding protein
MNRPLRDTEMLHEHVIGFSLAAVRTQGEESCQTWRWSPDVRRSAGIRYWRVPDLAEVEVLHADFRERASSRHVHEGYEIAVIERGTMRLRCRGTTHVAGPGDIVIINPDDPHAESNNDADGWTAHSIYPSIQNLTGAAADVLGGRGLPTFASPIVSDRALSVRIARMHRLLATSTSHLVRETAAIEAAVELVSRHALAVEIPVARSALGIIKRAREYLDSEYRRNVSLSELALVAGTSGFHLTRMFAREVGLPPHAYLTTVRLRHARRLLAVGHSIARTAADVGFVDQSHLTRHFQRAFGVTPGQFAAARIYNS